MVSMKILEAAEEGNIRALEGFQGALTESVADDHGSNCLHYAARQGGVEVIEYLVKSRGFTGNRRSNVGATPAHDAAAAGQLETLKWLLSNTPCKAGDQDGIGATVLHLACRFHHTHVTEWLLESGHCDITMATASGGIPLHFAVVGGDYEAVKLLLEEDPSMVNLQLDNGATPTYLAAQEGHLDILVFLITERRGNVKIKAYDGMSCTHAAAQSGHLDCVQYLVEEEKCNPNDRDFDGATPLHYAASQGHHKVIDWLMKKGGAKVTLDNLGGCPLHNAAETNQLQCVKVLISNGCSPGITDNNGLTAAELARKCFHTKCADLIETFNPQSQILTDPDIDYLTEVQSPRPAPGTYLGYHSNQGHVTQSNGFVRNGDSPVRSPSPVDLDPSPDYPTDETEDTGSIIARVDSTEFLAGFPRTGSQDFSENFGSQENLTPTSSLSSLSNPYDDIVTTIKSDQNGSPTHNASETRKLVHAYQGVGPRSTLLNSGSQNSFLKPSTFNSKNSQLVSGNPPTGVREAKAVSFHSESFQNRSKFKMESEADENWRMEAYMNAMNELPKSKEENSGETLSGADVDPDDSKRKSNGDIAEIGMYSSTNGDVEKKGPQLGSVDTEHMSHNTADIRHPIDINTQTAPGLLHNDPNGVNMYSTVISSNPEPTHNTLVNGNISPTWSPDVQPFSMVQKPQHLSTEVKPPPHTPPSPPPLSTMPKSKPFSIQTPSLLTAADSQLASDDTKTGAQPNGEASKPVTIPIPQAPPIQIGSLNDSEYSKPGPLLNGEATIQGINHPLPPPVADGSQQETTNNIPQAPPAPPPPEFGALRTNGGGKLLTNGKSLEEVKRKTTSLPARPASFTAEMMQNQRNSLNPAPARKSMSLKPDTDFLTELKKATKEAPLRRTSVTGEPARPALTPTMVFTAGERKPVVPQKPTEDKETKLELKGEWDPKNFVSQVPNHESLPSWKVQLQAKQIAEKKMKETLEKRKVEERESRFHNMPAWKRALIEKKEAEAKAAEEKKQQEAQQRAKVVPKKVPHINLTPMGGDTGSNLAPWQLELQKNA